MTPITSDELTVLAEARELLRSVEGRAQVQAATRYENGQRIHNPDAFRLGRFAEATRRAEDALFDMVNTGSSSNLFAASDYQIYARIETPEEDLADVPIA